MPFGNNFYRRNTRWEYENLTMALIYLPLYHQHIVFQRADAFNCDDDIVPLP